MERTRLQIDANQQTVDDLDVVVELLDATTRAEAVRRSVKFLLTVLRCVRNGDEIFAISKDGTRTRLIPT